MSPPKKMPITLNIVAWKAYHTTQNGGQQPDVSIIPPMLRRRLSRQGRAALSVMLPLTEQYGAMPVVYVSRHGELKRTFLLLEALAANEPLSPTSFSLSVHNSTIGLYSIHQQITDNMTAIAAGTEDLVPALLEARGMISSRSRRVLCVFCDEPPPEFYVGYCAQPRELFALAIIVDAGKQLQLQEADAPKLLSERPSELPQGLQLLDFMEGDSRRLNVPCNGMWWQLQRNGS